MTTPPRRRHSVAREYHHRVPRCAAQPPASKAQGRRGQACAPEAPAPSWIMRACPSRPAPGAPSPSPPPSRIMRTWLSMIIAPRREGQIARHASDLVGSAIGPPRRLCSRVAPRTVATACVRVPVPISVVGIVAVLRAVAKALISPCVRHASRRVCSAHVGRTRCTHRILREVHGRSVANAEVGGRSGALSEVGGRSSSLGDVGGRRSTRIELRGERGLQG